MGAHADTLAQLETRIGYAFKDRTLLESALTHPSFLLGSEKVEGENNQRLEFLGDALIGQILAEELYHKFPDEREGFLTRARALLVQGAMLAKHGRKLELHTCLRVSEADKRIGNHKRDTALEDAFEALVGALYLDGGFSVAKAFVISRYGDLKEQVTTSLSQHNPKGRLQELLQKQTPPCMPEYAIIESAGPDHAKTFVAEVSINGQSYGHGEGSSKKEAEENAASEALEKLASTDQMLNEK